MRFLADESCDGAVVRALREAGHDMRSVADEFGGSPDEQVIEAARTEERILLTEDRDFGHLVFAAGHPTTGVIYIRWPASIRDELPARAVGLVRDLERRLSGAFVVLQPAGVRIRRAPKG